MCMHIGQCLERERERTEERRIRSQWRERGGERHGEKLLAEPGLRERRDPHLHGEGETDLI